MTDLSKLSMDELLKLEAQLTDEIGMEDATQMAFKILANSGYGSLGQPSFRYYRLEIAEGITLTGQIALKYMSKVIDDFMNKTCNTQGLEYAIYGDTDSIFICLDKWVQFMKYDTLDTDSIITHMDNFMADTIEPLIAQNYDKMAEYLGANKNMMIMKREALADSAVFRGKKNYIMQLYDNEHVRYSIPKLKMMGVETAKTSTAQIIRDELKECYKFILNKDKHKPIELKNHVDKFNTSFMNAPVDSIASPRGVSDIDKWVDSNGNILKGCPIHVRASINYNKFIIENGLTSKYELIKNGSKIKFVKLKEPNILHSHVVAFIDEIPEEMELDNYIDRSNQFNETFMKPLESFTTLIEWDIRRSISVNDLFEDDEGENYIEYTAPIIEKPRVTINKEVVSKKKPEVKKIQKSKPKVKKKKVTFDDLF